jgi:Protein of unknown function (DUF1553)/Protein of unknown function (DUF1549)
MIRKPLHLYAGTCLRLGISLCVLLAVYAVCAAAKPGSTDLVAGADSKGILRKFELDIQPILTARGCNAGACHGKARGQNGFALSLLGFDADTDYKAMVLESRGRRLSFVNPPESLILAKATGQIPHGGGVRFAKVDQDYQLLLEWIESGATRTSQADPKLVSIDITPAAHSLAPEETESLRVTATYSDGKSRDVTRMCAFQSNEPAIVAINADGSVKAGKLAGEATIMARYMGKIATWSTAIPLPEAISADRYAALPRSSFIDDLVITKLSSLNIFPSEPCSETQFLRRLYLDAIGRIPTATEVQGYLNDLEPDKRSRWVLNVLDRPEYADYWANKWADLLRPNPYRVGMKATYSLDAWLRDAFRKNLPHDQFVKQLVTAQGSTWRNGAVTIFRDRRQPEEITTMISQLFLGVRLECAKCHQHPFEVYGQADFYGMAAHFARVGYKGTGISPPISGGEEVVFVKAKGEVRHPLTAQPLEPTTLFGEAKVIDADHDPREALADWMTSADNPFFSQVAANRLWAEVMGVGIVDPVDDLRATNPASNQALLSALADYFRSIHYDNKKFLFTIFTSQTYSLSSQPNDSNALDSRNYSRHYRKRLRAEVVADAITDITGKSEDYEGMPKGMRAMQLWTLRTDSELLDTFGRPDENQDPPCERESSATMTQTLHLMNAAHIQKRIASEDGYCCKLAALDRSAEATIEELYLTVFNRLPKLNEVEDLKSEFERPDVDRRRVVEDLVWAMLNAPEFLYLD